MYVYQSHASVLCALFKDALSGERDVCALMLSSGATVKMLSLLWKIIACVYAYVQHMAAVRDTVLTYVWHMLGGSALEPHAWRLISRMTQCKICNTVPSSSLTAEMKIRQCCVCCERITQHSGPLVSHLIPWTHHTHHTQHTRAWDTATILTCMAIAGNCDASDLFFCVWLNWKAFEVTAPTVCLCALCLKSVQITEFSVRLYMYDMCVYELWISLIH